MHQPVPAYYTSIDGLRAIAVLAVIAFHADFLDVLPGGFTGVDLFFVISGYVISQSLSDRGKMNFAHYLMDFYRRRFLRILPALLVVLLVSFLVSALLVPQFWKSEQIDRTGLAAFFGLSNLYLAWDTDTYFSAGAELNPYTHTWSLGVEEQFYLLFPAYFFVWQRYRQTVPLVWLLLPVLACLSLIICALRTDVDPLSAFYLLPGRFWELAAGAMLFQLVAQRQLTMRCRTTANGLLVSGLVLLLTGFVLAGSNGFPFPWALVTVAGSVFLIAALVLPAQGFGSPLQRLLEARPVTYIGRLSFSLYLWHWPVLVFLQWTIGTQLLAVQLLYPVLVLALAAASYHWIEMPLRTGQKSWQREARSTCVLSLIAISLCWTGAQWMASNKERLTLSQTGDTYTWYAYQHAPEEALARLESPQLRGRQLFVIGDSHTAAYRTMLNLVSLQLGIEVVEYEQGGCSVVNLMTADPDDCAERQQKDMADIERRANPGDIVFLASLRMPELQGREWEHGEDAVFKEVAAQQTPASTATALSSARTVLARLAAAKVHVLIDAPKPLFKSPASRCSDWFNRMNPVCAPGLTVERVRLEQMRAVQMTLLGVLKRDFGNLTVWDPFPLLCPNAICSAYDPEGLPLFFDSNHLSGHGNRVLFPSFTQALLAIWDRS